MSQRKSIFILRLQNANLAPYTNLLHAYKHLLAVSPVSDKAKYPSYNTFNRRLRELGSTMELQTSMGVYAIEHHPLQMRTVV